MTCTGDHTRTVELTCCFCGDLVTLPADTDGMACEHVGPPYHHDGCAGYPYCECRTPHKGDCQ